MINVLLLEKNLIIREAIKKEIEKYDFITLVQMVKEGAESVDYIKNNHVDIVIMDTQQTAGLVTVALIASEYPKVRIIGFTKEGSDAKRMIELGAYSCLCKYNTTATDLITEIKACYQSEF